MHIMHCITLTHKPLTHDSQIKFMTGSASTFASMVNKTVASQAIAGQATADQAIAADQAGPSRGEMPVWRCVGDKPGQFFEFAPDVAARLEQAYPTRDTVTWKGRGFPYAVVS